MKLTATLSLMLALSTSGMALAQSGDMKGMDMKGMVTKHQTTAVVKNIDAANGKVTLAHEPVKSLKWPAMTMGFAVKDKTLFDKLTVGNKVDVAFTKQGSEYVVTSVK